MQPAKHTVKPASLAMLHSAKLRVMFMQPFLVEGGDPTPPRGMIDVLTDAIFPDYTGSGCFDSR